MKSHFTILIFLFNRGTEGRLKTDLKTGVVFTISPENTGRYRWDISWDGNEMLQSADAPLYHRIKMFCS